MTAEAVDDARVPAVDATVEALAICLDLVVPCCIIPDMADR